MEFEKAFANSQMHEIEKIQVQLISYHDLIDAKKSSGRAKDIDDIENLTNKE